MWEDIQDEYSTKMNNEIGEGNLILESKTAYKGDLSTILTTWDKLVSGEDPKGRTKRHFGYIFNDWKRLIQTVDDCKYGGFDKTIYNIEIDLKKCVYHMSHDYSTQKKELYKIFTEEYKPFVAKKSEVEDAFWTHYEALCTYLIGVGVSKYVYTNKTQNIYYSRESQRLFKIHSPDINGDEETHECMISYSDSFDVDGKKYARVDTGIGVAGPRTEIKKSMLKESCDRDLFFERIRNMYQEIWDLNFK
jgi:hypothetical protein